MGLAFVYRGSRKTIFNMITYVNTVLVSNKNGASLATSAELEGVDSKAAVKNLVGKFAFMNCDPAKQDGTAIQDIHAFDADCDTFKIGVITGEYFTKFDKASGTTKYVPRVKWSNEIKVADIKSLTQLTYKDDTEDKITIDFSTISQNTMSLLSAGGKAIVLRLSWKDLPTRYRQWTDSYDYITAAGDNAAAIASGFAETINRQAKRARVQASVSGSSLVLEALPYDDDIADDTENPTAKVRFNANLYFMDPTAPAWASSNKYPLEATISKEVGVTYPASAKLVREHEKNAWGYMGVMHRCKWYDPKPALVADIDNKYGGITLEFENMYRAADDIFRKTKQTVEIYASDEGDAMAPGTIANGILAKIASMIDVRQKVVYKVDNSEAYDPENFASA